MSVPAPKVPLCDVTTAHSYRRRRRRQWQTTGARPASRETPPLRIHPCKSWLGTTTLDTRETQVTLHLVSVEKCD